MLRPFTALIILAALLPAIVYSSNEDPSKKMNIECYNCIGEDHECEPGILGEKVKCKPGVKHCVKTWTVETSPKTKRFCGTKNVVANKCRDVLFGANLMLYCPCNTTNFCNAAGNLRPTTLLQSFIPKSYSQFQPKVAFLSLVLIFPSFHQMIIAIQKYLHS